MGLKKSITLVGGIDLPDAYHRVKEAQLEISSNVELELNEDGESTSVVVNENSEFSVQLASYKDYSYRTTSAEPAAIRQRHYNLPLSALNDLSSSSSDSIKTKIYTHLKTLDEFSGAEDVIE